MFNPERLVMTSILLADPIAPVLDLREIAPRERHPRIFGLFGALPTGQSLTLLNDHDPQPLRAQFDARCTGQFEWTALVTGPAVWRVQITRVAAAPAVSAGSSCCSGGACCG